MVTVDEALRLILETSMPLAVETVDILGAAARTLAEDVRSQIDLPPFRQSAMDGYAVLSRDTQGASSISPVRLRVHAEAAAGRVPLASSDAAGVATRIFTGAGLPEGTDSVVRQEDVTREGSVVVIEKAVSPGANVREKGEELGRGGSVARAGEVLSPGHIAALSNSGIARVIVRRRPGVAVLTTGDEVVPAGDALRPGQVYDANQSLLRAWLGCRPVDVHACHLPDDFGRTRDALDDALATHDLVVTTGGVSVGEHDHIAAAARAVGVETCFWKVAQKPGKPLYFGRRGRSLLLGLPGNPGAVFVCLSVYVARALERLSGCPMVSPWRRGVLAAPVRADLHRDSLVRCAVRLDDAGRLLLDPQHKQASHMIADLGGCQAIARVPRGDGWVTAGSVLDWVAVA